MIGFGQEQVLTFLSRFAESSDVKNQVCDGLGRSYVGWEKSPIICPRGCQD
ncbi:Hypothetical protein FKW44_015905 [Caligus rogercresseyi]|uniref:Uncharacterized protein n=1 Tax=Caligus rogercresseyi TaxID=217165 RepID=A0A7T8H0Y7_CALRO|nr:Hypothetical protein FKW44_015905 [Caligus rogercresseyi]